MARFSEDEYEALVNKQAKVAKALRKPRPRPKTGINAYMCSVCKVGQNESVVERIYTGAMGGEKITRFKCNCGHWHERVGKGRWKALD